MKTLHTILNFAIIFLIFSLGFVVAAAWYTYIKHSTVQDSGKYADVCVANMGDARGFMLDSDAKHCNPEGNIYRITGIIQIH